MCSNDRRENILEFFLEYIDIGIYTLCQRKVNDNDKTLHQITYLSTKQKNQTQIIFLKIQIKYRLKIIGKYLDKQQNRDKMTLFVYK